VHRSMFSLQQYVRRTGDLTFPPPYNVDAMNMLVFVLKTNRDVVQELIDRELNAPWQQAFALRGLLHYYRPTTGWIVVVVSEAQSVYPRQFEDQYKAARAAAANGVAPPADGFGDISAHQRELLVMVPLEDTGPDPGGAALPRTSQLWYVPFALNDLPPAVSAGRETFGYPKLLARFRTQIALPGENERAVFDNPTLPVLDEEDAKERWRRLSMWTHGPVESHDPKLSKYRLGLVNVVQVDAQRGEALSGDAKKPDDAAAVAEEATRLFKRRLELLFLRQYLDPEFTDVASYQAVVSGSLTAARGAAGNLPLIEPVADPQRYRLSFPAKDLHQSSLADAMGIETIAIEGTLPIAVPRAVFELRNQNLVVTNGDIRWDKP
jgi:hypothetical protein